LLFCAAKRLILKAGLEKKAQRVAILALLTQSPRVPTARHLE
jgi:hypothetical protein